MNQRRTVSMLQRVPQILAVTAASYGLPPQACAGGQYRPGQAMPRPAHRIAPPAAHQRRLVQH